jgi:hypothetical protein
MRNITANFDSLPIHRAMSWLTGSVQGTLLGHCLYNCTIPPCTLSSRVVEGSTAASNLRGLSQPPLPLPLSLRFPLPVFAWATYATSVGIGAKNQVGMGLSYRPASPYSLATQFQARFLESIPRPIVSYSAVKQEAGMSRG